MADDPMYKAIFAGAELHAEDGPLDPSRLIATGWRRRDRG
jgi:hypothetical protein